MTAEALLIWLFIGAVAGWLAGMIMQGGGFGLIGDIVIGILGSIIGGWLLGGLFVGTGGIVGAILASTIGAIFLLVVLRLVRRIA